MRGWIYVVTAAERGGRVWIGHAAGDPATEAARLAGPPRRIEYDAVVEAPRDVVALVKTRLAALATADGAYRCSPEFAIAAIHHALGGPADGERIYLDDERVAPVARDPVDGLEQLAAHGTRRERGGALRSVAAPATLLLISVVLALYAGTRPAPRTVPQSAVEGPLAQAPTAVTPLAQPPLAQSAPSTPSAPSPPSTAAPAGAPADTEPATVPPPASRPPVTAAECGALWKSLLPRCASLPKRACPEAERRLAEGDRRHLAELRANAGRFDAAAFANFCRAACRHGYRPSREDFAQNVCGVTG